MSYLAGLLLVVFAVSYVLAKLVGYYEEASKRSGSGD
jgi:hypothetical protein